MTILTTHVGSLPRPKIVSDLLFSRENNEKYNQHEFDNIITKSVEEVVKKQSDIGVSIISDGEMSKISYATYVKDRYNGFAGDNERNPPQDLEKFPNYMKKVSIFMLKLSIDKIRFFGFISCLIGLILFYLI